MTSIHRLIFISVIIFIAAFASAAELDFGLKFGFNNTRLTNTEKSYGTDEFTSESYAINGLAIGVYIEESLSALHAIRLEVVYTQRKWRSLEYQDVFGYQRYVPILMRTRADYIDVAPMLKVYSVTFMGIRSYFYAGPVFSIFISDRRTEKYLLEYPYYSNDVEMGNDLSITLGGGIEVYDAYPKIAIDVRWMGGLKYSARSEDGGKHKSNLLLVTMGIGLGKR